MPLTLMDVKDLGEFNELLAMTGQHLPLDFITAMYSYHKHSGHKEYDHRYLVKSARVMTTLLNSNPLSPSETSISYAILFLMETGHASSEEFPYEVAAGLSFFFLEKHARGFFCKNDARFISRSCRPIYPHSLGLSSRVRIQLLAHSARVLVDVVYANPAKLVSSFVFINRAELKELDEDGVDIKEWAASLAEKFANYYGVNGVLWKSLSKSIREVYPTEIYNLKTIAHNKPIIHNLIYQYTKQIFA